MKRIFHFFIYTILFLFLGCSGSDRPSKGLLPPASGRAGEMILVMDSSQWAGELGDALRDVYTVDVPGLPREESMFKINRVEPASMTRILQSVTNLIFVVTLDSNTPASRRIRSYFNEASLERIKNEPDLFVYTAEDEYSKGQKVMYLFSQTEDQLINQLEENKFQLQAFFNQAEEERLKDKLFSAKAKPEKGLSKSLQDQFGCTMSFPFGYQVAHIDQSEDKRQGFMWFRQMNSESDKNIFVSYIPYRSENLFTKEGMIAYRDSVANSQLFGDPDRPESFVTTETEVPFIPVIANQIDFKGAYAMKMYGLWKTNNISMGGPFVSYGILDDKAGRYYYIEGFVYSPGKNQREYMRELKVILNTFRTPGIMNNTESAD